MRDEVRAFVASVIERERPEGPVLEVGSRNVNGSIRDLFPNTPYIGLDLEAGAGVDEVGDVEDHAFLRELARRYGVFKTVVSTETLEHIRHPFDAISNCRAVMSAGALLVITTVFDFPLHEYPRDYWRFTPDGMRALLEDAGYANVQVSGEGGSTLAPIGIFTTARVPA